MDFYFFLDSRLCGNDTLGLGRQENGKLGHSAKMLPSPLVRKKADAPSLMVIIAWVFWRTKRGWGENRWERERMQMVFRIEGSRKDFGACQLPVLYWC